MKIENTPLNKAKFFSLYFDQFITKREGNRGISTESTHAIGYMSDSFKKSWLELTPLSQITDEDAIEVANIINPNFKDRKKYRISGMGKSSKSWQPKTHKDVLLIEYERLLNHPDFMRWTKSDLIQIDTVDFDLVASYYVAKEGEFIDDVPDNYVHVIDFLRSKSYLLPYMGLSVETLIEYGWVKLKEAQP